MVPYCVAAASQVCNLVRHTTPLPAQYQNFDSLAHVPVGEEGYYGGSVSLADHCPYIQEFTWRSKNVVVRGSQCQFEDNNPSKLHRALIDLRSDVA